MLNPREASMPEMCARTPGWFCTRAESTCRITIPHSSVTRFSVGRAAIPWQHERHDRLRIDFFGRGLYPPIAPRARGPGGGDV